MNDIDRFKFSFRNALIGIKTAFKSQRNLRIHMIIGTLVLLLAFFFNVSLVELILLLLTILMVVISEMFNTALEFTVDLVSPEYSHAAKMAKDISAATVLTTALFAILIGILVFLPRIIDLISNGL